MENGKTLCRLLVGLVLCLRFTVAYADTAPFVFVNQNPFIGVHGLARDLGPSLTEPQSYSWSGSYSVASHFEIRNEDGEAVYIDGESTRVDLRGLWGVAPGWEVGVEVPYIRHEGGYLDGLIVNFHDWFGLPQNGRNDAPRDALRFGYVGRGDAVLLTDDVSGLGDIQAFVARELSQAPGSATVLRGHVKFPSGDEDDLLGSGSTDAGMSLHHQRELNRWFGLGAWIGATYLGDSEILPGRSRNVVAQGGIRTQLFVNQYLTLKVQWDIHSQVYKNTNLEQLNEVAYLLSLGGTLRFSPAHALDMVIVENFPHPGISPDVAFQFNWRWTPGSQ